MAIHYYQLFTANYRLSTKIVKQYASKLLLFGEYTIINASRALAMPYGAFSGHWARAALPDEHLQAFAEYLAHQAHLSTFLDVAAFQKELEGGLFFDSNIPIGYGLGSSGALCAAVYDRFAVAPIGRKDAAQFGALRQQFALMESHFHGSSSGTDPLICYLEYPILIRPEGKIELVELPELNEAPYRFFLLDTGITRSTGPLVNTYMAKCENSAFKAAITERLKPTVDQLIDDFLAADWPKVEQNMKTVSLFQLENFEEMIPAALNPIWEKGIDTGTFTLKLCGAGGGGFLLGIAKDQTVIDRLNEVFPCRRIW